MCIFILYFFKKIYSEAEPLPLPVPVPVPVQNLVCYTKFTWHPVLITKFSTNPVKTCQSVQLSYH
eukprot:COSAG06_NODE_60114_length_272_cov_0.578035_1_plen_65_part_01